MTTRSPSDRPHPRDDHPRDDAAPGNDLRDAVAEWALQAHLDRQMRGQADAETPLPGTARDRAAYRAVYAALAEPPAGRPLPPDFAERVAERVRPWAAGRAPARPRASGAYAGRARRAHRQARAPERQRASRDGAGAWLQEAALPVLAMVAATVLAVVLFPSLGRVLADALAGLGAALRGAASAAGRPALPALSLDVGTVAILALAAVAALDLALGDRLRGARLLDDARPPRALG